MIQLFMLEINDEFIEYNCEYLTILITESLENAGMNPGIKINQLKELKIENDNSKHSDN